MAVDNAQRYVFDKYTRSWMHEFIHKKKKNFEILGLQSSKQLPSSFRMSRALGFLNASQDLFAWIPVAFKIALMAPQVWGW